MAATLATPGHNFYTTVIISPSSFWHPSMLDNNITTECNAGCILGPFSTPPLPKFHCSGWNSFPKHDGGWRAIYHLSTPYGSSINDSIDRDTYTLFYCYIDDTFAIVLGLGKGILKAKTDLRIVFYLIPV